MHRHLSLHVVQYRTRGKCPSFCCKDFFVTIVNCRFILMSIFNWTLWSVPLRAITCGRPAVLTLESVSQKVLGLLYAELHRNASSSIATRRKYHRPDFVSLVLESTLRYIHQKTKTFLLQVTVTLTITQMMLLAQNSHSYWQYRLSNYCTCSPHVYRGFKWVMTNSVTPYQYNYPL